MECRYCKEKMEQDDIDRKFKGNEDIYWVCPKCEASCIEQIRFAKPYKKFWHKKDN